VVCSVCRQLHGHLLSCLVCRSSTMTNTTKESMCYSDFPMPGDFPNYLHNSKYLEYFRMYADHFQLDQFIQFETEVMSVEQHETDGQGRWTITTRNTKDSSNTSSQLFDAVMVCVGIHSRENTPSFEGADEFKGELIHSVKYRFVSINQRSIAVQSIKHVLTIVNGILLTYKLTSCTFHPFLTATQSLVNDYINT